MEFECYNELALREYWEHCSDYYDEDEIFNMSHNNSIYSYED